MEWTQNATLYLHGPLVQWIEQETSKLLTEVRFLQGPLNVTRWHKFAPYVKPVAPNSPPLWSSWSRSRMTNVENFYVAPDTVENFVAEAVDEKHPNVRNVSLKPCAWKFDESPKRDIDRRGEARENVWRVSAEVFNNAITIACSSRRIPHSHTPGLISRTLPDRPLECLARRRHVHHLKGCSAQCVVPESPAHTQRVLLDPLSATYQRLE